MATDLFSLVGKISVEYSDAINSLDKVSDSAEDTSKNIEKVGDKASESKNPMSVLKDVATKTKDQFSIFNLTLADLAARGIATLITKCGELASQIIELGNETETSFAKLETIAGTENIDSLTKSINKLSKETGVSSSELANVAYNAISAGTSASDAAAMVETATKLATAGFTDSESALSVLTTAINSYGDSCGTAEEISDSLIQVQNLGVTTIGDLSSSMGKAIATGSAYSVNLGNLESAYVSITKAGISTEEGTTYLNSMLNELGDTGSDVGTILKEKTGKSFTQLMEDGYSLGDVLGILYDACGEDSTALMNLWSSAEAGKASNAIVNQGLEQFNENLETIQNSSGATEEAYSTMSDTMEFKMNQMKTGLEQVGLKIYSGLEAPMSAAIGVVTNVVIPGLEFFIDTLGGIVSFIVGALSDVWNSSETLRNNVQTMINTLMGAIQNFYDSIIAPIVSTIMSLLDNFWSGSLSPLWENVKQFIASISTLISEFLSFVTPIFNAIVNILGAVVGPAVEVLGGVFQVVFALISSILSAFLTVATGIFNSAASVMQTLRNNTSTIFNAIKSIISTVMNTIKSTFTTVWNAIKTTVTTVINAIKSVISSVFNATKTQITNVLNSIKSTFTSIWNGIKTATNTAWNAIKSYVVTPINNAYNTVKTVVNSIKSTITSVFNSVKSSVSSIFTNVYNAIKTPMNNASTFIKGIVDKIKGFFKFSISWPSIKLPHFSITPSGWSVGDLLKGKIPTLGISWYAKAMDEGMIMNQPTIFGYQNGQLMAGGEAGSETVVGTQSLMNMISAAVNQEESISRLDTIIALLNEFLPKLLEALNIEIVLDDKTLVGKIADDMDKKLGKNYRLKERGV